MDVSWTIKKAEHRRTVLEKMWCWRSPLHNKEIKPVNPKGDRVDIDFQMEATESSSASDKDYDENKEVSE